MSLIKNSVRSLTNTAMNLPNLKESIITSYWDTRPPTEDQVLHFPEENDPSRSSQSSLYTLISGVTSVASEVSSYWAKVYRHVIFVNRQSGSIKIEVLFLKNALTDKL